MNMNDSSGQELGLNQVVEGIISSRPEKDLVDVIAGFNYYKSATENLTKDSKEALSVLYDTIQKTRHFLIDATNRGVLGQIEDVKSGVFKRKPTLDAGIANQQLQQLKDKGESHLVGNLVLVFSEDFSRAAIFEVPKQR